MPNNTFYLQLKANVWVQYSADMVACFTRNFSTSTTFDPSELHIPDTQTKNGGSTELYPHNPIRHHFKASKRQAVVTGFKSLS